MQGIGWAMERMNRASENLRNGLFAGLLLIVLYGSGSFVSTYFGEYRATSQQSFQFGMAEALRIAELESSQYDQIVLSPLIRGAYVFVLFFTQSDPTGYQTSRELGKYVVDAETVTTPGRYLFLLNAFENLGDLEVSHWIRRANDEPYLKLIPLQIHPE